MPAAPRSLRATPICRNSILRNDLRQVHLRQSAALLERIFHAKRHYLSHFDRVTQQAAAGESEGFRRKVFPQL